MAAADPSRRRAHLAGRFLQVGATVLAIGVLIYFAARSTNGGVAGYLLSFLLSWIAFDIALSIVRGMWRESQMVKARHAIVGGCLTIIAVCMIGGFIFIYGNQLLLGVIVGGVTAYLNSRNGWVSWRQLTGMGPAAPPQPSVAEDAAVPVLGSPPAVAAAAVVALICLAAGLVFAGFGTVRVLEGSTNFVDIACTPPCALVNALWVQVITDSQGQTVARPDASTIELHVSFRDDAPNDRVVTSAEFTLTGPGVTYQQALGRAECDPWELRLHIDDRTQAHALCFTVPSGAGDTVDPHQLLLDWTPVQGQTAVIPLALPYTGPTPSL